MIDSLLIYVFCTNCKHEIVFNLIHRSGKTISVAQLLQNCKLTNNLSSNFGLTEESINLSRNLLAPLAG